MNERITESASQPITEFLDFVSRAHEGELSDDCTRAMNDLFRKLHEHQELYGSGGANAKLTIEIDFSLEGREIEYQYTVKPKPPVKKVSKRTMFLDSKARLTDTHPKQLGLFGKDRRVVQDEPAESDDTESND